MPVPPNATIFMLYENEMKLDYKWVELRQNHQ
jgi:hypothetical protein